MTDTSVPFVPLEFPAWLRWGQRRGAFIDNLELAARYPDHRYWRGTEYGGAVRRCGWCAGECKGRRTAWCSDRCSNHFYRVWSWGAVAEYVFAREAGRCARCRCDCAALPKRVGRRGWSDTRRWQVDHIVPVKDGGTDDPANLRLLCHDCHVAVGYEQRAARKVSASASADRPAPALGMGEE